MRNNLKIVTLKKKNIRDFASERNSLLKKTKAEWVFFLDSDEKIPIALKKEIFNAIKADRYSGYYVRRKNYFMGTYAGEDKIIRLAKKNAGKWKRAVHEIWEIKGRVGELKNPLIHNTGGVKEMVRKLNFYSDLHAKENIKEKKESTLLKVFIYPIFKFIQSLTLGRGVTMSMLQSFHSFLSWTKQWELQKR